MKKLLSGNEAIAQAALACGCRVITGYPGTPSSEVIGSLLKGECAEGRHIEWSVNEKVAVEIAAGAAWAGQRALCTMKMSGLNVAYDSLIGIAYSGCKGGLVIYVADDPGVSTGMCEQDSRGFALMSELTMLDPATVEEAYTFTKLAFELSEAIESPVFVRGVTNVSQSHSMVECEEAQPPLERRPYLVKDIRRFTKAGPVICLNQRARLTASLAKAEDELRNLGFFHLRLADKKNTLGIAACGAAAAYVSEALALLKACGHKIDAYSLLQTAALPPFATNEIECLLKQGSALVVLEEMEPYLEQKAIELAYRGGYKIKICGKTNGFLPRSGEYNAALIAKAIAAALGFKYDYQTESVSACGLAVRPITTCAGCPHRGSFMALNKAVKQAGYKKDEVLITGDIGCTILGMNPPFACLWTELSMGASISLAQGYARGGLKTPVIATIGDSTFFHAGLPALANAVQQNADLTVLILDNGWTAMTGMQVNPGTALEFQQRGKRLDLAAVVRGFGVEYCREVDPYDLTAATDTIAEALKTEGVKVIICRRECAISAARRRLDYGKVVLDSEKCLNCYVCIKQTGCPALVVKNDQVTLEQAQCNGCGLCLNTCKASALKRGEANA